MRAFSSVCGGLPSPAALAPDNPLQYGFSWSPAGARYALVAAGTAALLQGGVS